MNQKSSFFWFGLLTIIALFIPSAAKSESAYKPRSIGYIYEECKKTLGVKNIDEFNETYCGNFLSNYWIGLINSNFILVGDPLDGVCKERIIAENQKINDRGCASKQRESLEKEKLTMPFFLQYLLSLGDYPAFSNKEILNQRLVELYFSSEICTTLQSRMDQSYKNYKDAEITRNISAEEIKNLDKQKRMTQQETYSQCSQDIKASDGVADEFDKTICGAQINGFLEGYLSNYYFSEAQIKRLKDKKPFDECDKEALDLYTQINAGPKTCITPATRSIDVAKRFVRVYEKERNYPSSDERTRNLLAANTNGSMPGYIIVYFGHSCDPMSEEPITDSYNQ